MAHPAIDVLRASAFELSAGERARLARDLLASLDGPADADVAEAWEAEILRRIDQIEDGSARLLDRAELRRRMRSRVSDA